MNRRRLAASWVTLALAPAAHAQLNGHALTADWLYPIFNESIETHDITVGPDVELKPEDIIRDDDDLSIDLDASTVTFSFINVDSHWSDTDFNGWCFADADGTLPAISGYSVLSYSEGMGNLEAVVTGYSDDAFWADFGGLAFTDGASITLQVTFVPAPAAAAPIALASLGRRRRS